MVKLIKSNIPLEEVCLYVCSVCLCLSVLVCMPLSAYLSVYPCLCVSLCVLSTPSFDQRKEYGYPYFFLVNSNKLLFIEKLSMATMR